MATKPSIYMSYPHDRYRGSISEQRSRAVREVIQHLERQGYDKVIPANRFYTPKFNEMVLLGTTELNPKNKTFPHDFVWRAHNELTFIVSVVTATPNKFVNSFWKTVPLAIEAGSAGINYLQIAVTQTPLKFRERFPTAIQMLEDFYNEDGKGFAPIVTIDEFKDAVFLEMASKGRVAV